LADSGKKREAGVIPSSRSGTGLVMRCGGEDLKKTPTTKKKEVQFTEKGLRSRQKKKERNVPGRKKKKGGSEGSRKRRKAGGLSKKNENSR